MPVPRYALVPRGLLCHVTKKHVPAEGPKPGTYLAMQQAYGAVNDRSLAMETGLMCRARPNWLSKFKPNREICRMISANFFPAERCFQPEHPLAVDTKALQ